MSESVPPLISKCPSCGTRFRVTEEQLAVAGGRVRCGACLAVFDGREALVTAPATRTEAKEAGVADDPLGVLLETALPTAATGRDPSGTDTSPASAEQFREGSAEAAPDRHTHPVAFAVAIAAALAFLAAGLMAVQYDVLVRHPELRDVYAAVGVKVPRYRALGAIRVANRSVDERSGGPDGLIVRLDLANTAPRYQDFPILAVRFQRADGAVPVDEQRVAPVDYLPSPTHSRRMVPNQATTVLLHLDDPGPDAVSYSISLL